MAAYKIILLINRSFDTVLLAGFKHEYLFDDGAPVINFGKYNSNLNTM